MGFIRTGSSTSQDELSELLQGVHWHDGYFSCCCPFDTHEKPALLVYEDGAICLSCQSTYSLDFLYKKITGNNKQVRKVSLLKSTGSTGSLPPWRTWLADYETWDTIVKQARDNMLAFPEHMQYLKSRSISPKTIADANIGWIDGWITFPCYSESGDLVDLAVRSSTEKSYVIRPRVGSDDYHLFVPSWKRVKTASTVVVPFGLIDCLSLYEAGFAAMTGITGKQLQPFLFSNTVLLTKKIVVVPDYNESGGGWNLVSGLGWRGQLWNIDWSRYPDCKDPNDIHKKFGLASVIDSVAESKLRLI